jgi:nucleoside phosphorylase
MLKMVVSVEEHGTVVVLAPMNLEYKAMRRLLADVREVRHRQGTVFEVGQVPGTRWQIALMVTGEGIVPAAVLAERAIVSFDPQALFVVGVAGGLRDDISLGDIVVATWVHGYHGSKEDVAGFGSRPRGWGGSHQLVQVARLVDIKDAWTGMLAAAARPVVHFKPIAAGEVVLNSRDTPLAEQLIRHYNDAVAIETESSGAAVAAHLNASLPVLTIRGISDKTDGRKHIDDAEGLQSVAASHAAAFTIALLRELPVSHSAGQRVGPGAAAMPGPWSMPVQRAEAASPQASAPPSVTWLPDLGGPRAPGAASLEIHLIPADRDAVPEAHCLTVLGPELAHLGRTEHLFASGEALTSSDPATVGSARGNGLAVTRTGQRSAWQALPVDTLGAVLDPADATRRLAALLRLIVQIRAPAPDAVSLAVGITPNILVSEGLVADLPRRTVRMRTSMARIRVQASDILPFTHVAACPHDVAEELSARLLLAFRSV